MKLRVFYFASLLCIIMSTQELSVYAITPQVATDTYCTIGLKSDGKAVAVGANSEGQCNVSSWEGITQISCGELYTIGLKSDGTVVATGWNEFGQCNVSSWRGIIQVSAGSGHAVGLKSDGTVVATGWNIYGQCNVSSWRGIAQISAGYRTTIGLKLDGTLIAVGDNSCGQCNVSSWTDIIQVSAGAFHTVGLKSNGTVLTTGSNDYGQCEVSGWTDVTQISPIGLAYHTVGLKSDGTVLATGWNVYGQCNVSGWRDIVQVASYYGHTVGLKSDGTVVAVGLNYDGECNVSNWNLGLVQPRRNKFWGIFVGQDFFADNLRGDLIAKDIYDKFKSVAEDRRYLITDSRFTPVTKGRIESVLDKIKLKIKPGDTLFFYIVGHGSSSFFTGNDETTLTPGDEYVMVCDDFVPDVSYITDDELKSLLGGMDTVQKWIMIDSCHSGGFWGNHNSGDSGDLEKLPNVSMIASAQENGPGKYIGDDAFKNNPDFGKTAFGIVLRDGFSLKANNHVYCDSTDDGIVTFGELKNWMTEQARIRLNWLNGLTLRENEFGDDIIFSVNDWNPVCEKSNDFTGSISSAEQTEIQAEITSPSMRYVGEPILFDASGSFSQNGGIIRYEWDWNGDGVYEAQTNTPQIEHTFSNAYDGIVVLRITDTRYFNDTTSISIAVNFPSCECDLNHDGRCDMRDWLLFGQRWGATNCLNIPCACDLNADGRCDMRDWLLFGRNWGRTDCPTQ